MALDDDVIRLAKGPNLATVVTLMPNGQPQALLTWVDTDGEVLLVNTEPQRQRARNVARDPRMTVLIHSADNPWDWAEVGVISSAPWPATPRAPTSTSSPTATWAPTTRIPSGPKAESSCASPPTR